MLAVRRRGLLLACACLAASGAEPPPPVKTGVDSALQKRIDEAIAKGRQRLVQLCREGDPKRVETPESLRQQAKGYAPTIENLQKQIAKLKEQRGAQARQHLLKLQDQLKSVEKQVQDLLKKAVDLERNPSPPPPPIPRRDLAPVEDFSFRHGEQALIGLALVQSGMKPSDPVLQGIWSSLKGMRRQPPSGHETYTLGLALLFTDGMMHSPSGEAWPPPECRREVSDWVQDAADALAAGCDGGAWTYRTTGSNTGNRGPKGYAVSGVLPVGSDALKRLAVCTTGDYSNTQYAVLGLKAAALCGARIPGADRLWRLVLQQFLEGQEPDGKAVKLRLGGGGGGQEVSTAGEKEARARGWGYVAVRPEPLKKLTARPAATATMSAAGLTALLVARSELKLSAKEKALVEQGVRDGLAWFQENWSQSLSQGKDANGYLLYGIERVGVLGSLQSLGDHAWYAEGARHLTAAQSGDGSWPGGYGEAVNTALCLLFLSRGTREAYARSSYDVVESPASPVR